MQLTLRLLPAWWHRRPSPMTPSMASSGAPGPEEPTGLARWLGVFAYARRAVQLVWATNKGLTIAIAALTLIAGLLPPAVAWVGAQIVDSVVEHAGDPMPALTWVGVELVLVASLAAIGRGQSVTQSLLRAELGHRVNRMILEKALTLDLEQFEDSSFYDKLTRARRQASSRPLSLVNRTFSLVQQGISLVSYAALLWTFSPLAVLVLVAAGLPAFFVETKFSGEAFRLFKWRSPETRQQMYLETVLAREDHAKEVALYGLGRMLLDRYNRIFELVYAEDRSLTLRRGAWGFAVGLLATLAFYGAYGWIAVAAVFGSITIGAMTMYLLVFKQGQSAFSSSLGTIGGMYEDNLYISLLYEFLEQPAPERLGSATEGPDPGDGLRFEDVWFRYPGARDAALRGVSFHLRPGEKLALVGENGSGKTTIVKLMTRLYAPSQGRVTLDGLDLQAWDVDALRARIGVLFQDFVRYQLTVGENIGVGDVAHVDDATRQAEAAERALAMPVLDRLPHGLDTQLGRWFKDGQELSGGQWQKVALARLFMRKDADLLVLDEPTSAMDAEAEARLFDEFRARTEGRMAVVISHRFSTVRMADRIVVLHLGEVVEQGDHHALMAEGGRYARLFSLQAAGYR